MVARKLGLALITGNSVVLKPSNDTPSSAAWIVYRFVQAGIPKGVLNLVTGKGSEIGDYIASHKGCEADNHDRFHIHGPENNGEGCIQPVQGNT